MASPPYNNYSPTTSTAISPPASSASRSQLPPINTMTGKRKTTDGAGAPALKRRKASTMSVASGAGSAHPLRQTSFPPDEFGGMGIGTPTDARSPSVDLDNMSFVSGSQVSAAAAPVKKKRGRKSKAEKAQMREQTPSVAGGGKALSAVGGVSDAGGRGGAKGGGAGGADDGDGEDDGPTEVAATGVAMTKEEKMEEHRTRNLLINAFTPDQFDRYENWRAANFSKAGVRRLVNATISQSVTENVVVAMRAVSKVYIGDIIEAARKVQAEWIANTGEEQATIPTPPPSAAPSPDANGEKTETSPVETEPPRGPLRPEHLREAVRRYRRSLEGGGVGMQRLWHQQQQNGADRFPSRTGGRRIFR